MWPWEFLQTPSSLGISPEEAMAEDTRKAAISPSCHQSTALPLTSVYIIHPLAVLVILS